MNKDAATSTVVGTPTGAGVLPTPAAVEPVKKPATSTAALPIHQTPNRGLFSGHDLALSKIMIVDDEKVNVLTVRQYLIRQGYKNIVTTCDSRDALGMVQSESPDIVLLDVKMPYVSGLEILEAMHKTPNMECIPVIILTAATDPELKRMALDLGATDFLNKPIDLNELIPRVRNALVVKSHLDQLAGQAAKLEKLVQQRTAELSQSRQQLILSLARAAEHRDNDTSNHVLRVGTYAGVIANQLNWSDRSVRMIEQAAQLHDVGKIGIPDSILFKKGQLEPDEYDIIRKHCTLGREIIEPFSRHEAELWRSHTSAGEQILNIRSSPMLVMASRIAQTHHEHWDGKGYPLGLAGSDIPIEGRVTSVADVYDALASERPYKNALPREECFAMMAERRGTQFDPHILDAFFSRSDDIIRVQMSFVDV